MLFPSDFDGTIAHTFVRSPNGLGVNEVYRLSCIAIFGHGVAKLYDKIGGIDNRAPVELITHLLEAGNRNELIESAYSFFAREGPALEGFVPKGKGVDLELEAGNHALILTEILVRVRMRHFWSEIGAHFPDGRIWPEPCQGFTQFYKEFLAFREAYSSKEIPIELGILSSGHDLFLEKCFQVWGLPAPTLMVTDDLMRSSRAHHIPPRERVKPHRGPFRMLWREWRQKFGGAPPFTPIYVGDSLKSDRAMAQSVGVAFAWFNPARHPAPENSKQMVSISDWRELEPLLKTDILNRLHEGSSISDLIKETLAR